VARAGSGTRRRTSGGQSPLSRPPPPIHSASPETCRPHRSRCGRQTSVGPHHGHPWWQPSRLEAEFYRNRFRRRSLFLHLAVGISCRACGVLYLNSESCELFSDELVCRGFYFSDDPVHSKQGGGGLSSAVCSVAAVSCKSHPLIAPFKRFDAGESRLHFGGYRAEGSACAVLDLSTDRNSNGMAPPTSP